MHKLNDGIKVRHDRTRHLDHHQLSFLLPTPEKSPIRLPVYASAQVFPQPHAQSAVSSDCQHDNSTLFHVVRVPSPWDRTHGGEDEDLKKCDGRGCDVNEELREDCGVCWGMWVGEDEEEVEEGGWEWECRDKRVEGTEEEGEGRVVSDSGKKTFTEAGAMAERVREGGFSGDADEGPELNGGWRLVWILGATSVEEGG